MTQSRWVELLLNFLHCAHLGVMGASQLRFIGPANIASFPGQRNKVLLLFQAKNAQEKVWSVEMTARFW